MDTRSIPPGFHSVTPFLVIRDVPQYVAFLERAFNAVEGHRILNAQGQVMYTDVTIGDSKVMLCEAMGRPASQSAFHLYVPDTDAHYRQALDAGADSMTAPSDQFYGDRLAGVRDPWGSIWWIATRMRDVPVDESERIAATR